MKITYDLEDIPQRPSRWRMNEETVALIAFLASTRKNMCFEYEDEKTCKKKYLSIRSYRNKKKLTDVFDIWHAGRRIYIVRLKRGSGTKKTP